MARSFASYQSILCKRQMVCSWSQVMLSLLRLLMKDLLDARARARVCVCVCVSRRQDTSFDDCQWMLVDLGCCNLSSCTSTRNINSNNISSSIIRSIIENDEHTWTRYSFNCSGNSSIVSRSTAICRSIASYQVIWFASSDSKRWTFYWCASSFAFDCL
jgi:hypothetical protein